MYLCGVWHEQTNASYRVLWYLYGMETKHQTSLRLSPEARRLLNLLARHLGVSMSAVLELAIREKAKNEFPLHHKELAP